MREPTAKDLENRLSRIVMRPEVRMPYVGDVNVQAVEVFADEPREAVLASDFGLLCDGSDLVLLQDFLWAGVLGGFDEPPVEPHPVTREFDPPVVLMLHSKRLARISSVTATVGEMQWTVDPFVVGGGPIVRMIANVLDNTRVSFTDADRTYVSDDLGGEVTLATDVILGRPEPDADA